MATQKIAKTDIVKELVAQAFPSYRGRKFLVANSGSITLDPYDGGGTRSEYVAIDRNTGKVAPYQATSPFSDRNAYQTLEIPENLVIVEHAYFQGLDCGITFHLGKGLALEA